MRLFLVALLVALCAPCSDAYNILVYIPKFAHSHINFMGRLADVLVEEGHNVTALISELDATLFDGTKLARIIRVPAAEGADHMNKNFMVEDTDMFEMESDSYGGMMENARHNAISFCRQCRKLITTEGLVESLKAVEYDAFITETFENCGVGLSYLIAAKSLIPVSSMFLFDPTAFGVSDSKLTEPAILGDGQFYKSMWLRLRNFYLSYLISAFYAANNDPIQAIFDEIYPGTPTFQSLLANAAVIFPNSEPLIDFARPTIAKIVPIGGINVGAPKKLDDYWNGILSLRPKNVLISFGTIAKSVLMKPARKQALLEAFSSFPDTTFIWKYENVTDVFANNSVSLVPNVILTEWMPQLDILADSRISLFISHGGMASCHEVSTFGVPALFIPIFGDQIYNSGALAHSGMARVFNKFDMVYAGKVREAIEEMLSNESYRLTAHRIRDQLAARPLSPRLNLVKHVEFAAKFGQTKSLKPLSLHLTTIQYYGVDLVLVLLASISLVTYTAIFLLRLVRSLLSSITLRKVEKVD